MRHATPRHPEATDRTRSVSLLLSRRPNPSRADAFRHAKSHPAETRDNSVQFDPRQHDLPSPSRFFLCDKPGHAAPHRCDYPRYVLTGRCDPLLHFWPGHCDEPRHAVPPLSLASQLDQPCQFSPVRLVMPIQVHPRRCDMPCRFDSIQSDSPSLGLASRHAKSSPVRAD
jgi:hypothetical protein